MSHAKATESNAAGAHQKPERDEIARRITEATRNAPRSLREAAAAHLDTKGKMLRGLTAFHAARAFGAQSRDGLTWAAAVELIHNASLIHDDICDKDHERRGAETIFTRYGEAIAVCLGDYFIATSFQLAAQVHPGTVGLLAAATAASTGGQAAEFTLRGYPSWAQYCEIAVAKTSPLLGLPVIGAAMVADHALDRASVEAYFNNAAICFQVLNDIDNVLVTPTLSQPCSDLIHCRPNAVLASLHDSLNESTRDRMDQWSDACRANRDEHTSPDCLEWWHLLRQSHSVAHTAQRLYFHFNTATTELNRMSEPLQVVVAQLHTWLESAMANASPVAVRRREARR